MTKRGQRRVAVGCVVQLLAGAESAANYIKWTKKRAATLFATKEWRVPLESLEGSGGRGATCGSKLLCFRHMDPKEGREEPIKDSCPSESCVGRGRAAPGKNWLVRGTHKWGGEEQHSASWKPRRSIGPQSVMTQASGFDTHARAREWPTSLAHSDRSHSLADKETSFVDLRQSKPSHVCLNEAPRDLLF